MQSDTSTSVIQAFSFLFPLFSHFNNFPISSKIYFIIFRLDVSSAEELSPQILMCICIHLSCTHTRSGDETAQLPHEVEWRSE